MVTGGSGANGLSSLVKVWKEKMTNTFNQEELVDFEFPYKLLNSRHLVLITQHALTSDFEEVDHITDCPTIPILSGFSQFCLKIPNPNQHVDQDRKNPDCDIFSDFFLLIISDRNCPLKTLEWGFRASTFKNFTGEHSPDLPGVPCLQRLHDSLVIKHYPDFTSSHGWTV